MDNMEFSKEEMEELKALSLMLQDELQEFDFSDDSGDILAGSHEMVDIIRALGKEEDPSKVALAALKVLDYVDQNNHVSIKLANIEKAANDVLDCTEKMMAKYE